MATRSTPPTTFRAFRPAPDMDRAMLRLQAKTGISFSEQIRRAMDAWLPKKGVGYRSKKRTRA